MKLAVKNWAEFQHYKDRSPPWIKLYKTWLDDRAFQRLPDASRALAPCIWLLASEKKDGVFDGSVEEVAFRVHQTEKWVAVAIKPLISAGFLIVAQDASATLADRKQSACLETETETETEKPLAGKPDGCAREVLDHLNATAGRSYRPVKTNISMIVARMSEGATVDECKSVINDRVSRWGSDPKMAEYLRPATLFNATKFAQYLGDIGSKAVSASETAKPCAHCKTPLTGGYTSMAIGRVCNPCYTSYTLGQWNPETV